MLMISEIKVQLKSLTRAQLVEVCLWAGVRNPHRLDPQQLLDGLRVNGIQYVAKSGQTYLPLDSQGRPWSRSTD